MGAQNLAATDLLLPERARLLHIGPPKTGTTATQDAFVLARKELAKHGVAFPSDKQRQPLRAVLSVTGARGVVGQAPPSTEDWERLRKKVAAANDKRVMISSEFFADANDEQAATIVDELGDDDVHIVLSLRPIGKIMPSQWQQYVQNGNATSYEDWLRGMLEPPYDKPTPSFWRRHNCSELVRRWASLVGKDRLTVIVIDESDRDVLLRHFESMLGLPANLLKAEQSDSNRSLTWGEVELVRQLNKEHKNRGWTDDFYARYVRYGGVEQMRTRHEPLPFESRIRTPAWAERRAAEIGKEFAEELSAMDLRVIGDLSTLAVQTIDGVDPLPEPALSSSAAAQAMAGALAVSPQAKRREETSGKGTAKKAEGSTTSRPSNQQAVHIEDRAVGHVPGRDLLAVVAKRLLARIRRSR